MSAEPTAYVPPSIETIGPNAARFSSWLVNGPTYEGVDPEAVGWRRIAKLGEEVGEVIEAWLGHLGENPRKGVTGCVSEVIDELLDVATCALGAIEHFTGNAGESTQMVAEHLAGQLERVGIEPVPQPEENP